MNPSPSQNQMNPSKKNENKVFLSSSLPPPSSGGLVMKRVLESTRWVDQTCMSSESPRYLNPEILKDFNDIGNILMEATKIGTISPLFDSGEALTKMYQVILLFTSVFHFIL
jgi:hypothetical protein